MVKIHAQASLAVHPYSCSGAKGRSLHADFHSQAHLDDSTYCLYDTNTRLILAKHDVSRQRRCRSVAPGTASSGALSVFMPRELPRSSAVVDAGRLRYQIEHLTDRWLTRARPTEERTTSFTQQALRTHFVIVILAIVTKFVCNSSF